MVRQQRSFGVFVSDGGFGYKGAGSLGRVLCGVSSAVVVFFRADIPVGEVDFRFFIDFYAVRPSGLLIFGMGAAPASAVWN